MALGFVTAPRHIAVPGLARTSIPPRAEEICHEYRNLQSSVEYYLEVMTVALSCIVHEAQSLEDTP